MPIIAQYTFDDTLPVAADSATGNGAQNGIYLNGATSVGGNAVLDGDNDLVKIYPSSAFQMDRGTLDLTFTRGSGPHPTTETVLSRDSVGNTAGGFRVEIQPNGAVVVSHETPSGVQSWTTPAGFANNGDTLRLNYSWDLGGAGGALNLVNDTTPGTYTAAVPNTVTMNQGTHSQPWIVGAGQSLSDPDMLNNIDQHFQGQVGFFQLRDDVTPPPPPSGRDGIVWGTGNGDLIDTAYTGDNDGDRVDANDAILPGEVQNDDIIRAGAGNDTVLAGDGQDDVTGGTGDDSINGGAGNDSLQGEDGNDSVYGDDGNDTLEGGLGNDELIGGLGNDQVNGGAGNDELQGNDGDDTIQGGSGNDTARGGAGNDLIITGLAGSPDRTYPGLYTADTNPNDDRDLVIASFGDDTIQTGDDADTISAGDGNDLIDAGVDDDSIAAGSQNDTIIAGEGNDTVAGDDGNDLIYGGLGGGVLDAIDLVDASDLDNSNNRDSLTGGAGDDTIYGLDDNDTLNGGSGNDLIAGGNDDDWISGGDGNDVLTGDQGNDTVGGDAGNDLISGGVGNDSLMGGDAEDTLNGEDGNDTLFGDAGNDVLGGGTGDDNAQGGAGNDVFTGGTGNDSLIGGADRDRFLGGNAGDFVDGSETGDDYDTLDLRGLGAIRVTYDPTNAENGTVTFLNGAGAPTGTMQFVNIENVLTDGPVAQPDVATTPEDTPVTITVLANDTDPNGDPLTVTTASAGHGTVTINPDGTLRYTPNPDYNGPDTITYTVRDPAGNTDTTTVSVTVTPVNDPPNAVDDVATTPLNTPVTIAVLGNDTDPDGDTLSISGTPTSPNGTVTVNPDGTIRFVPNTGFTGVATINYTITDGHGGTDSAVVRVTVGDGGGANRPPVAVDDTATTAINTPVTIPVLANDSDPDGNPLTILGTPTSPNGTVTVNPDGTIRFVPNPGFTGPATITYVISDGHGGTDTGTVTVTVRPGTSGPDGIVRGTGNDDVIDRTYVDPTDGDRVDANDQILPGAGVNDDVILAGDGNDRVIAGDGNDSVEGGDGNDSIEGRRGNDTIYGGNGNDTVHGGTGNDSLFGGNGNDSVIGGRGDDVIDTSGGGTAPLPDIDYPGLYPGDTDPNNDRDLVRGGTGNDTIRTGDDADTIYGGYGNDLIEAGVDADSVEAGIGNDTVVGGEGSDTINGGQGNDLIYGGYGPGVPDAVNIPDANGDLRPQNGRDLIRGGSGDDTIYGMDDDDSIYGGGGNDVIDGGIDEDTIFGDMGNDQITGGQGNDVISGGRGNDTISGGAGTDTLSGDADRDTFVIGSQNDGIGDTIYGGAGGDDFDRMVLTGAGPYRLVNVVRDSDGNGIDGTVEFLDGLGNVTGRLNFTNIEEIVPCFTPGTLIATPQGEVPVEALRAGDRILTRDNGIQEIRWVGRKDLNWRDLHLNSHLRPVHIKAGSLGNGLPERDMLLSPNHRVLVSNERTALYFDEHEVLVSAKHLASGQDIGTVEVERVSYIHFMFDRHEVVLSNGAWTESFQPGDYSLKGIGNAQRSEIFELFPELQTAEGLEDYQSARRVLKRHEAALLAK